jgi:hypothetical protein
VPSAPDLLKFPFTFKRNLRHLFAELEFAGRVENHALLKAAAFLQDLLRQGKSPRQAKSAAFPVAVVPKSLKPYLFIVGLLAFCLVTQITSPNRNLSPLVPTLN